ncbi:hypothetical protein FACS1894190_10240 [Spirochaetia bacterium]|nr:hypothetical protein FACS1894190_10240 [Spirochaetia bacterium]
MYYTDDFIDGLIESGKITLPHDEYVKINAVNISKMLDDNKMNYKLFGVYWWGVKDALRKYVNNGKWYCGIADDPLMKERADHGSEFRNILAGMYYMNEFFEDGITSGHYRYDKITGGEHDYTLFDDNAGV